MVGIINTPSLTTKELRAVFSDFKITPWRGLLKACANTAVLILLITWMFSVDSLLLFVLIGVPTGFWYGSTLILTHDAIHHTLTGWKTFDEIFPRLLSYPALWFHGLYSELHRLHHKMNGNDPLDPESPHWTRERYDKSSKITQFYVRHHWGFDLFLFAGFGMLAKHLMAGISLYSQNKRIRKQLWADLFGILLVNGLIYTVAIYHHKGPRYLFFFLLMERTIGFVQQLRSKIEHYGLWDPTDSPFESQLFNSRNIKTSAITSWYFNALNFHSIHHGFPKIPFYRLKEAHKKLQDYCIKHGKPLLEDVSYLQTALRLAKQPFLIEDSPLMRPSNPPSNIG